MELFIKIEDGQLIGHPVTKKNLLSAFPNVDANNLPNDWVAFERVPEPELGVYEVVELSYGIVDGIAKDVWSVRQMTNEEKTSKQNQVKATWAEMNGYASWVFNEDQCCFLPPIDPPQDGQRYMWDESTLSWGLPDGE